MSIASLTVPARRNRRREKLLPWLLLSPALVLLAGMIYPFALGFYYSFTAYWLQYPKRFRFIWFDNYLGLLEEPLFDWALPSRSSSTPAFPGVPSCGR
jgi:ABC-type sugar transport system permease subunit